MIQINGMTKKYGKLVANDDINLSVGRGELAVLLGPNGAGKSTLIKSVCGLLRFEGSITIGGYENHTTQAKQLMGYIPEFPVLYPMLTVAEHLEFIARAYRLDDWEGRAEELLYRFELDDKKKKLGKELSKGMQQKVSVCCALLPQPQVVVFDEPLVGLDPHGIRETQSADVTAAGQRLRTHRQHPYDRKHGRKLGCDLHYGEGTHSTRLPPREIKAGQSLEDVYFDITEGHKPEETPHA